MKNIIMGFETKFIKSIKNYDLYKTSNENDVERYFLDDGTRTYLLYNKKVPSGLCLNTQLLQSSTCSDDEFTFVIYNDKIFKLNNFTKGWTEVKLVDTKLAVIDRATREIRLLQVN